MFEIIGEFIALKIYYDFRKKKKARRKLEQENNLPKKIMINPIWKSFGIFIIVLIVAKIVIGHLFFSDFEKKATLKKITELKIVLEKEKKYLGIYPKQLKNIIRNNPLNKEITKDYWNTEFYYKQKENGSSYTLISKGKDKIINTVDDIK